MYRLSFLAPLVAALVLCGCCAEEQTASIRPAPAAAPCAPQAAASPCAPAYAAPQLTLLAPSGTFQMPAPVGVRMRVGAAEHARAALGIPPAVAACFVTGGYKALMAVVEAINCAAANLIPTPTPTASFVYPQVTFQATAVGCP